MTLQTIEPFKINWNLERFFYRTMEYDQNCKMSAYRKLRKLGMLWVRNAIIAAHMHGRNYVTITIDDRYVKYYRHFLEGFGFEVVGVVAVEWDWYDIRF